jgi:hypothetical protein
MKNLSLLLVFILLTPGLKGQVIRGKVTDKNTGAAIGYASLYFTGTFVGTTTDTNGNFELDVAKFRNMPLRVSAIGYNSATVTDFLKVAPVLIYLEPKVYQLGEVTVKSKSLLKKRQANLLAFRQVFLGTTDNSRRCFIRNEDDITFNYGNDRDTLKAFASKPLEIENRSLGYLITYYLEKFEVDRNSGSFAYKGDLVYREDLSAASGNNVVYQRRRRSAYLGSRMHFFRALWQGKISSAGFTVSNSAGVNLKRNEIVLEASDNQKYLRYYEKLGIEYYSNNPKGSLEFLCTLVPFDSTGYYDEGCIQWEGMMADKRIADWLPYEYVP